MKCMRCGEEMRNTIGGCYTCDNCGFAVNDLVLRCETKNSKTAKETNVIDGKDLIGIGKIADVTINGESYARGEVWDKTTNVETDKGLRKKIKGLEQQLIEANINIGNLVKAKSLSDEIKNNALKAIEKLQKERQLIKSIIQSAYNGGTSYCTLPNGKEISGDMGYVIQFYDDICKNYPELKNIFGEQGEIK